MTIADIVALAEQHPADYGPASITLIGTLVTAVTTVMYQWWALKKARMEIQLASDRQSFEREQAKQEQISAAVAIAKKVEESDEVKNTKLDKIESLVNGNLTKKLEEIKDVVAKGPGSDLKPPSVKALERIAKANTPEAELARKILSQLKQPPE